MKRIEAEFERVQAVKSGIDGDVYFSDCHKKTREWDVLGTARLLLIRAGLDAPAFAIGRESPDFETFDSAEQPWGAIEIVDVLEPGYRRHEFHKRGIAEDVILPIENEWQPLREQIAAKAAKAYPDPVTLMAYYTIIRPAFTDWRTPFDQQLLREHERTPFAELTAFRRVLILNAAMDTLVELHPIARAIIAEPGE